VARERRCSHARASAAELGPAHASAAQFARRIGIENAERTREITDARPPGVSDLDALRTSRPIPSAEFEAMRATAFRASASTRAPGCMPGTSPTRGRRNVLSDLQRVDRRSARVASLRFRCAGMVPTWSVAAAIAEAERIADLGLAAAMLPLVGTPEYNHPSWRPLWSAIEETGLPVVMHQGSGHDMLFYRGPGAAVSNLLSTQSMAPRAAAMLATSACSRSTRDCISCSSRRTRAGSLGRCAPSTTTTRRSSSTKDG